MRNCLLLASLGAVLFALGLVQGSAVAAPWQHEERMRRLHHECDHGDRRACVQFGILIGENHDRHGEWHRSHPEWWWWNR